MTKTRTIEIRKRGIFGKLFKFAFVAFNLVMAIFIFTFWYTAGSSISDQTDAAAQVGGVIGTGIASSFLFTFWLLGAAVLGALMVATRGKKITTTEVIEY